MPSGGFDDMRLNERAMRGAAASHEGATPCTYMENAAAQRASFLPEIYLSI